MWIVSARPSSAVLLGVGMNPPSSTISLSVTSRFFSSSVVSGIAEAVAKKARQSGASICDGTTQRVDDSTRRFCGTWPPDSPYP
jgi:hypothetical protein